MTDLSDIGARQGVDKVCNLDYYSKYFEPLRDLPICLLEIGVRTGESVRTWAEYFPNASIFGLDIVDCMHLSNDRINIVQGDQSDLVALENVCDIAGRFDIVIDDGSHINDDIITSFNYLFKNLVSGGVYIIEDLYNSYPLGACGENKMDQKRATLDSGLFSKVIFEIDKSCYNPTEYLAAHFWPGFCVIIKA